MRVREDVEILKELLIEYLLCCLTFFKVYTNAHTNKALRKAQPTNYYSGLSIHTQRFFT